MSLTLLQGRLLRFVLVLPVSHLVPPLSWRWGGSVGFPVLVRCSVYSHQHTKLLYRLMRFPTHSFLLTHRCLLLSGTEAWDRQVVYSCWRFHWLKGVSFLGFVSLLFTKYSYPSQ